MLCWHSSSSSRGSSTHPTRRPPPRPWEEPPLQVRALVGRMGEGAAAAGESAQGEDGGREALLQASAQGTGAPLPSPSCAASAAVSGSAAAPAGPWLGDDITAPPHPPLPYAAAAAAAAAGSAAAAAAGPRLGADIAKLSTALTSAESIRQRQHF